MRLTPNGRSFAQCYPDWVCDVTDIILADQTQATFGIFGRWGSGKSSAMEAVIAAVPHAATRLERHVICMEISCLDLQRSVLLEKLDKRVCKIIGATPKDPFVSPSQVTRTAGFLGSIISKGIQAFSKNEGIDKEVTELTGTLSEGLVNAGIEAAAAPFTTKPAPLVDHKALIDQTHVLWFLDDLDRCYPDRAMNFLAQASTLFNDPLYEGISSSLIFACDPEVLGRHAASVYGISLSEGLEAITKYIHVPISIPIAITRQHSETISQYIPENYRRLPAILGVIAEAVGVLPVRELLSALPQAFLWYKRCMSALPQGLDFHLENGQSADLFGLFLWWSLVAINLPAIHRYLLKDSKCFELIEHLFKISSPNDAGGGNRIVAEFGDLAIETIRLRPDLCCAFSKLRIAKINSAVIQFSLKFVGGGSYVAAVPA